MAFRKILFCAVSLFLTGAAFCGEHFVRYQDGSENFLMPCNLWYAGCAPTAASMVLGYWDNYGQADGGYLKQTGWGRLKGYFMDRTAARLKEAPSGGTYTGGAADGIDGLIYDLARHMDTDAEEGSTLYANIGPGIRACAAEKGYAGLNSRAYGLPFFIWERIKAEIDNNRPFVWSTSSLTSGHSVAAWGYTDDGYVIVYNTWDEMRHDFNYNYYIGISGIPAVAMQVDTVEPPFPENQDVELTSPQGGETWHSGSFGLLRWTQYGGMINKIRIYFSRDGGFSWNYGGNATSAQGENTYMWPVPVTLTGDRVKIRIEGWLNDIAHYASSGTRRNIYCVNATATISPTFSATPTITPTHTITKTHTISPTATVTPVNTPSLELVLRGIYPNPVRKGCEIVFYLSRKADVKACFYSVDGSRVAVIRKTAEAGEQRLVWKREISGGNMVPPGVYICVVEAVAYADKAIARLKAVVY